MTYYEYLKDRKKRLNSDEQVTADYFNDAAIYLDRFETEINNPQPTTYKDYSQRFEALDNNAERVQNYIESQKGTENYDTLKSAFDTYSSAIKSAREQLNQPEAADAHIRDYLNNMYNKEAAQEAYQRELEEKSKMPHYGLTTGDNIENPFAPYTAGDNAAMAYGIDKRELSDEYIKRVLSNNSLDMRTDKGRSEVANKYHINENELNEYYAAYRAAEKQQDRQEKYDNLTYDELVGLMKSPDSLGQRIYQELSDEYGAYLKDYSDYDKNRIFQSRAEKYGLSADDVRKIYEESSTINDHKYDSSALNDVDLAYVAQRIIETGTADDLKELKKSLPVAKYYDGLRYQLNSAIEEKNEERYYLDLLEKYPDAEKILSEQDIAKTKNGGGRMGGNPLTNEELNKANQAVDELKERMGDDWDNFYKFRNRYITRKKNEEFQKGVSEWTSQNPFNATVASIASIPVNMVGSLGDALTVALTNLEGEDGWYDPKGTANYTAQNIRGTVTEMIDNATKDSGLWNYWAKQLYSSGMSGGDMLLAAAVNTVPVVGQAAANAMFFSSAGVNAANDVIENGGDLSQATAAMIATGGAELIFERISLDKLEALAVDGNVSSAKEYFKNIAKQAFVEGSEEFNTTLANTFTDALINGGNNSIARATRAYMAQGMNEKEAENAALKDWTQDIINDAVGGALTGGVAGGVAGGYNYAKTSKEYTSLGKELLDSEGFDLKGLIEQGKQSENVEAGKLAEKLEKQLEKPETPSAKSVGNLQTILQKESDIEERHKAEKLKTDLSANEKKIIAKVQNGSVLSKSEVQEVKDSPKLAEAIERFTGADPEEIKSIEFDENRSNKANFKTSDNGTLLVNDNEFKGGLEIASVDTRKGLITYELNNPDGSVEQVTSDNIRFKSADEALLHERAASYNTDQARAFVENYHDGQNVENYAREWNLYSNYGRLAVNLELDNRMNIGGTLTNDQKIAAYQQGLNSRVAHNQVQTIVNSVNEIAPYTSQNQGAFAYDVPATVSLTKGQAQVKNFLRDMTSVIGLNVHVFQSKTDANGLFVGENGSYDPATNTLYVDVNAGLNRIGEKKAYQYSMLNTVAHELTHVAKLGNKYEILREAIISALGTTENKFNELVEKKFDELRKNKKYKNLSDEKLMELADEEVICDSCETMLQGNTKFFENLYKKDKSLAKSFAEAIKNLVEKIKAFVTGSKYADTEYGKALLKVSEDIYNQVQQLWNEAVESGLEAANAQKAENKKATDSEVKEQSRYAKQGGEWSEALTGAEWAKYNNAITSGVNAGLRISDNSILVECEEGNIYDYKFVIYDNTFEDDPITGIYALGNLGNNVPEAQDIARYVQGVEDRRYAKQKILKELLKRHAKKFGYVLRRYNTKTGRYNHIGGTFTQNRADFADKSNGTATYTAAGQIKFSDRLTQTDRNYLSAVERGDMETAQKMVDEAAKAAGYGTDDSWRMDHKAPNSRDNVRLDQIDRAYNNDGSIYSRNAAYYYGDGREYDNKAIEAIRKARNNPDALVSIYRAVPTQINDKRIRNGDWVTIDREYAEEHGWRMFDDAYRVIENKVPARYLFTDGSSIHEFGYDNGNTNEVYKNTENNVKLATVTYDDDGKVIPLSERFKTDNADIRYQDRDYSVEPEGYGDLFDDLFTDDGDMSFGEESDPHRAAAIIEQMIEYDAESAAFFLHYAAGEIAQSTLDGLKDIELSDSSYLKIAKKFYNTATNRLSINSETIADQLKLFVMSYDEGLYDSFDQFLTKIVDWNEENIRSKEFLSEMNLLTNAYSLISYIAEEKASYANKTGEMSEKFAKMERATNKAKAEAKQLKAENKELNRHLESQETLTDYYRKKAYFSRDSIANLQLLNKQLEKARAKAEQQADRRIERTIKRYNEKLDKQKLKTSEQKAAALDRMRERYEKLLTAEKVKAKDRRNADHDKVVERYEKKIAELKEKANQQKRDIREDRDTKLIAAKDKRQADLKALRDNRDKKEYVRKIKKVASELQQWALHPTDKHFVPQEFLRSGFYQAVNDITEALIISDNTQIAAKLRKIATGVMKLQGEAEFKYDIDPVIAAEMNDLADAIDDKKINRDLTLRQAEDIYRALRTIKDSVVNARKLIFENETRDVVQAGIEIINEQKQLKPVFINRSLNNIKKYFLTPERVHNIINGYNEGSTLDRVFQEIKLGIRKKNTFYMDANKMFDAYRNAHVKDLDHSQHAVRTVKWTDNAGNERTTKMTGMQAMQLVMTWNREVADNRLSHMRNGGVSILGADELTKGNIKKAYESRENVLGINESFITSVSQSLTEFERGYIDIAEQFFNVMAKDAINEVSLKLRHFETATSDYYIPIKVDDAEIVKEIEGVKHDSSIENMGMLKSVVPHSDKSVLIQGLDNVINKHVENVGNYYGLAIPIRNMNKVLNVSNTVRDEEGKVVSRDSVKKTLEKNWGKFGTDIYEQLLIDLQNSRAPKNEKMQGINKMTHKIRSNFVTATLSMNPSVVLKQAASYSVAGVYLDQSALAKGSADMLRYMKPGNYQALLDEIDSHTPQHYMRRAGLSSNEVAAVQESWVKTSKFGRKINNSKLMQKMPGGINPANWIQEMDCMTTAALWCATKAQIDKEFKKSGKQVDTNEYWQEVTALYDKVIEDTQPMYDPMHRPEILKSSSELVKSVFMFKTQPLQNSGIIYDALGKLAQNKKDKAARRQLRKALVSQGKSLLVFAGMSLFTAFALHRMGRYKDEDDEVTAQSIWDTFIRDVIQNGAGVVLPFGGNEGAGALIDMIDTGKLDASSLVQDNVAETVTGFFDAGANLVNTIGDQFGSGKPDANKIAKATEKFFITWVSDIFGAPVKNAKNIIKGGVDWAKDIADGGETFKPDVAEMKTKQVIHSYQTLFEIGENDRADSRIQEFYDLKLQEAKSKGENEPEKEARNAVRDAFTTYYKEMYKQAFRENNTAELERIRKILISQSKYMVWGKNNTPLSEKLREWQKEAAEEQKEE